MCKNKRLLMLLSSLIVLTLLLLAGNSNSYYAVAKDSCLDEYCAGLLVSASEAPLRYSDIDELLQATGMAKFSEFAVMGRTVPDSYIIDVRSFDILSGVRGLYMPSNVRSGFEMYGINVRSSDAIAFLHSDTAGNPANFIWSRSISAANATTDFFGRGAIAEYIIQRNGVDYFISEWVRHDTREPDGWVVAWAQNGQAFMASLPANFTLENVLAFCDAQALTTWELEGNAVSISIQGMANVSIFESSARGYVGFGATGNEIIVIGNALYRSDNARNMERIGYRWLIDEVSQRYQYVLQPGAYEFRAEGVVGQPELLVQHFAEGNRISNVDYSKELAEQPFSQFNLSVTSEPEDNVLDITSSFFQVWNHAELVSAVQTIVSRGYTEQYTIQMMQDFNDSLTGLIDNSIARSEGFVGYENITLMQGSYLDEYGDKQITYGMPLLQGFAAPFSLTAGGAILIPEGVNIILTSYGDNVFTYTRQINNSLHFSVSGTLTLQNVILSGDGAANQSRGGINIHSGGHLIMEEGSGIINSNSMAGGGVDVTGGTFTMNGGIIEGNTAGIGGGVSVTSRGLFIMEGGIIRNNQSTFQGGGVAFNILAVHSP